MSETYIIGSEKLPVEVNEFAQESFSGVGNKEISFSKQVTGILISNDGQTEILVIIHGITYKVKGGEVFKEKFPPFLSMIIISNKTPYRGYGLSSSTMTNSLNSSELLKIIAWDSFTRPDGNLIDNKISDSGHEWFQYHSGNSKFYISNGSLLSDSTAVAIGGFDVKVNKAVVTVDFTATQVFGGILFGVTNNGENALYIRGSSGTGGVKQWMLQQKVGTTFTTIATADTAWTNGTKLKLKGIKNGNNIKFFMNDVLQLDSTLDETVNVTFENSTTFGIFQRAGVTLDNLVISNI